jgi:hypothetical protein
VAEAGAKVVIADLAGARLDEVSRSKWLHARSTLRMRIACSP